MTSFDHIHTLIASNRHIAHRGLFDHIGWFGNYQQSFRNNYGIVPENSLLAFSLAIEHGFAIELDINMGQDGAPLIFHDYNLERLTGLKGNIQQISIQEAKKTTLLSTHHTIPTFQELLELVQGQVPLYLEIKVEEPYLIKGREQKKFLTNVIDLLKNYKGAFTLQSFCPEVVVWLQQHFPRAKIGIISYDYKDENPLDPMTGFIRRHLINGLWIMPDYIAYDINAMPAVAPIIAHKLFNIPLIYWTLTNPHQHYIYALKHGDAVIFEGFFPHSP